MLPLHDLKNPDAEPVGYLTSLRFNMGGYLAPEKIA
ncbi:DUF6073 family protein [Nonomuraea ferruginea]